PCDDPLTLTVRHCDPDNGPTVATRTNLKIGLERPIVHQRSRVRLRRVERGQLCVRRIIGVMAAHDPASLRVDDRDLAAATVRVSPNLVVRHVTPPRGHGASTSAHHTVHGPSSAPAGCIAAPGSTASETPPQPTDARPPNGSPFGPAPAAPRRRAPTAQRPAHIDASAGCHPC